LLDEGERGKRKGGKKYLGTDGPQIDHIIPHGKKREKIVGSANSVFSMRISSPLTCAKERKEEVETRGR